MGTTAWHWRHLKTRGSTMANAPGLHRGAGAWTIRANLCRSAGAHEAQEVVTP